MQSTKMSSTINNTFYVRTGQQKEAETCVDLAVCKQVVNPNYTKLYLKCNIRNFFIVFTSSQ